MSPKHCSSLPEGYMYVYTILIETYAAQSVHRYTNQTYHSIEHLVPLYIHVYVCMG